jgi:hypothetical protein
MIMVVNILEVRQERAMTHVDRQMHIRAGSSGSSPSLDHPWATVAFRAVICAVMRPSAIALKLKLHVPPTFHHLFHSLLPSPEADPFLGSSAGTLSLSVVLSLSRASACY